MIDQRSPEYTETMNIPNLLNINLYKMYNSMIESESSEYTEYKQTKNSIYKY